MEDNKSPWPPETPEILVKLSQELGKITSDLKLFQPKINNKIFYNEILETLSSKQNVK